MLSREMMGLLALGILWVNALLIAMAAAKQAIVVLRRLRALKRLAPGERGVGLWCGKIAQGSGADGAIARYEVAQVGRAAMQRGAARTIHFADRTFSSAILGGVIAVDGVSVQVPAGEGEVWPGRSAVDAAVACPEPASFAKVYDEARKARGHGRTVAVELRAGQTVWVAGQLRAGAAGLELHPAGSAQRLVSARDPRAWLRGRAALAIGFVVTEVLVAAAITAVALVPPLFGRVSTIGGVLGLGFFLAVQPLGTAVRDALLAPSRASVRGLWVEALTPELPPAGHPVPQRS